jgi:cobalt-zinc-cadmium efflux system membrane fusion protein
MHRLLILAGGICLGIALALTYSHLAPRVRNPDPHPGMASKAQPTSGSKRAQGGDAHAHEHGSAPRSHDHEGAESSHESGHSAHSEAGDREVTEGAINMTSERVVASNIAIEKAGPGKLVRTLSVPAVIVPDRNRVGRVPAKVTGTVSELKKRLGELVAKGEVVAVLDSREVADAKSEYIAALVNFDLQKTLYEREETLWKKQVTAEQRLLKSRATHKEAQVRRDLARQKLLALGVNEKQIANLSADTATALERYDIRAPIGGRVVEQLVDVGTPVGGDGQSMELFAISDLSVVWAELTVSTVDLGQIKEGQSLTISSSGTDHRGRGSIIFTSPVLDKDTRSARVIASIDNKDGIWRPGMFVTADVAVGETRASLVVPGSSIQKLEGAPNVFVRTAEGFQARQVRLGEDDGRLVEI